MLTIDHGESLGREGVITLNNFPWEEVPLPVGEKVTVVLSPEHADTYTVSTLDFEHQIVLNRDKNTGDKKRERHYTLQGK